MTGPVVIKANDKAVLAFGRGIKVSGDFESGDFIDVTLKFKNADAVTLSVPVVDNNGYYASEDGDELTPAEDEEEPSSE